jgi:copper(I)-binding protein
MWRMIFRAAVISTLLLVGATTFAATTVTGQAGLKASSAWAGPSTTTETTAFAVVENGTMYDVYIVGAETDVAGAVELVQVSKGKPGVVKEVTVAAFDRLEMSPEGTFLRLTQLRRPLKTGESVTITLKTDTGTALSVDLLVK